MRLCNRCNQWGETAEPCTCTDDLMEADQDIAELKAINGRLQYQNDRLSAKVQKLELAEKMAREARVRMVAAEQRAAQAEAEVERLKKLHNMQTLNWSLHNKTQAAEIEKKAAAQAERDAVRECERIAYGSIETSHTFYPIREAIRNRWPQHFKGE